MLKGEELSSAYASADVFMMPSETETLGFVALEAMASGLPVVAVAAGGLVDIVTQPGVIGAPPARPGARPVFDSWKQGWATGVLPTSPAARATVAARPNPCAAPRGVPVTACAIACKQQAELARRSWSERQAQEQRAEQRCARRAPVRVLGLCARGGADAGPGGGRGRARGDGRRGARARGEAGLAGGHPAHPRPVPARHPHLPRPQAARSPRLHCSVLAAMAPCDNYDTSRLLASVVWHTLGTSREAKQSRLIQQAALKKQQYHKPPTSPQTRLAVHTRGGGHLC